MRRRLARAGFVFALGAAAAMGPACQRASDATLAKRMPQPPPSPSANVAPPATLRIEVAVAGKPAAPITAATLRAVAPDFQDAERRAWKLVTLIGASAAPPGTEIVVTGDATAGLVLRQPAAASDPQPALMLNRRGEIIATVITPGTAFPPFHGEGGRLRRPGDTTPHLGGVTRIQVARAAE